MIDTTLPLDEQIMKIMEDADVPKSRYASAYSDLCEFAYNCTLLQYPNMLRDVKNLDRNKFKDEEEE